MVFLRRSQRGQALAEFALILPLLLLLVFGIIEFGRIFYSYLMVTQAAREGARLGAVGGSDQEIVALVRDVAVGLDENRIKVDIDPVEDQRSRGDSLRVAVSYDLPLVAPIITELLPNPFPLTAVATMRVE
ncbi:MAG TPA: pilus assembly protein TadE [Peptococcaceae bacterium]|nr:pilus assembly protein TadE [Peptococcaceae bacterium]